MNNQINLFIITSLCATSFGLGQQEYNFENIYEEEGLLYQKSTNDLVNGEVFQLLDSLKVILGRANYGKKDGNWIYRHKNGKKHLEVSFKNNKSYGSITFWYDNGQKESEGLIKHGKLVEYSQWNEDGSIK